MTDASTPAADPRARVQRKGDGWFAGGGILGALLAASCCVVPLVLVTIGVSGAWIGNLTALAPYQPLFAAVALLCIGLGFRHVYFSARADCIDAASCAPPSRAATKAVLWLALGLTIIALTTNWWAPLFY